MKQALLVGAVLLSGTALAADKFELKGDAAKGEATYKTMCVSCHGEKGDGNGPAGAALNPKPTNFTDAANAERLTDEYAYKIIKEGGAAVGKSPLMVAWSGSLKDDQLRDVAAFVLKFKPAKAAPAKKDAKKDAKKAK
ncbi:MAG: cytochrome c [Myxococcales bacterium]|nr:cytochrome c [Myxococcales bacterium]